MDTTQPLIKIAAVSVIAVCLSGVGVLTGLLPMPGQSSRSPAVTELASAPTPAAPAVPAAAATPAPAATAALLPAAPVATAPATPAATHPAAPARRATPVGTKAKENAKTAHPAPAKDEAGKPANTEEAVTKAPAAPAICRECGVIESIMEVKKPGAGTGLGAVAGGVLGGILGNQIGGGKGRTAMAVLGAAGGAYAGNQVERNARSNTEYQITVRFEDGTTQLITETNPPVWRNGDRVKVSGGLITGAN